jgi:hypothetical protein
MKSEEIPHFVLRTPFGMTMKNSVILNGMSGEVKNLIALHNGARLLTSV